MSNVLDLDLVFITEGAESVKKWRVLLPLSTPIPCHMVSTGFSDLNNTREILESFSGEKLIGRIPLTFL